MAKKTIEKKITLGRDAEGKLIRRNVRGKTKAEVERKAFEMRQKWLEKSDEPDNRMTFLTYARHWFKTAKALKSENTKAMYENVIEKHLTDFKDQFFDEISLSDFQIFINKRADRPETCKKIRLTLKQICAAAMLDGVIKKPIPIERLSIPVKQEPSEKRALTPREENAVMKANFNPMQKAFVYTLYYTGMRREEALALTPAAINLDGHCVTVSQTLIFDKGVPVIRKCAKNAYSLRTIPLPDAAYDCIKEYLRDCGEYLFPMPSNKAKLMSHSSYVKFWAGIQRVLLPLVPTATELTAHIFRHNYATKLFYSGITPKKAAKLMGHANTTMIMKVYAHLDESRELSAEKLNKVFADVSPSCPQQNNESQ